MSDLSQRGVAVLAVTTALLVLAGCAGAPPSEPTQPPTVEPQQPGSETSLRLDMPDSEWRQVFDSAEDALARRDWMSADAALAQLPTESLGSDDAARRDYLSARIAYLRGDTAFTRAQLQSLESRQLNPAIAYRVTNFHRHVLTLAGENMASARIGAVGLGWAPEADREALKRSIWADLQRVDSETLQRTQAQSTDSEWSGWLALALLSRESRVNLASAIAGWLAQFPNHPASDPLPGGLEYLRDLTGSPYRVTLLLPLSGRLAPAGKAVRDGFLASFFEDRRGNPAPVEVAVIDTNRYDSAATAYEQAIVDGASFVIGPLSKAAVAEVAARVQRPVPILALNRIEGSAAPSGAALVQLSLAPEDEAARIAELAYGRGARRALLLRPAGAWGDEMEDALRTRWQALGGISAEVAVYTGQDEYSAAIKDGLGVSASERRRRTVADMLATPVEFTPRRRQDLDAVFMLAQSSAEARALKPLLAFHYAGALPVYATSSVYGGREDPRDKDLDGLNLVVLPWMLGSNPDIKSLLDAGGSNNYPRLQALGADAYRLQSHFNQLQAGPDALLRGDTGLLTMNPQLQILREPPAATFDGPKLRAAR
jgi:outer membrane PBP1 activator LpoA protein